MSLTLYHNPRCSKSRQALALLQEKGVQPEIILYMDQPPSPAALQDVLQKLGLPARALLRQGEEAYRTLELDNPSLPEQALIEAMCQHPRLIERPIAIRGTRAIIGRPPEQVLQLL